MKRSGKITITIMFILHYSSLAKYMDYDDKRGAVYLIRYVYRPFLLCVALQTWTDCINGKQRDIH